jgi:ABC-2 type transport system ATP-binding protein
MFEIKINSKKYGHKVILEDVNLTILNNGIYGVVGKNGEGKTTFFKCLKSLTDFEGSILMNKAKLAQNEIAWSPTEPIIYDELTAKEFSKFYSELLKIPFNETCLFDVPQDKLIRDFSTGMKKKANLNAILQKTYTIYIFDEPFNGLDLESNYQLMRYIKDISKNSIVFISSHILEILYKECDMIFMVKNKRITTFEKSAFNEIESALFTV